MPENKIEMDSIAFFTIETGGKKDISLLPPL